MFASQIKSALKSWKRYSKNALADLLRLTKRINVAVRVFFHLNIGTLWSFRGKKNELVLLALLLNVNAGQSTQDSWPMFRHDPAHIGFSTSTAPSTNQTLWRQPTSGQVRSSPAVANGVVYVGSSDSNVYAIGPTTPTANSGTPMNTYYIVIAAVAVVFAAAAVISLLLRKRPK